MTISANMPVCISVKSNMKRFCARLHGFGAIRKRKDTKRVLEISAPFNFKKEETMLPGLSENEISVLREKAAASRLGIADHKGESNPFMTPDAPRASAKAARSPTASPVSPISSFDLGHGSPTTPVYITGGI